MSGSDPHQLIIGVGNRWRGDDALGPRVAEALSHALPEGWRAIIHEGEGAALMALWEGLDRVILVDAAQSGAKPGTIHDLDATATPLPTGFFRYSSHQFGLAEAVETARALGGLPNQLRVIAVEGQSFDTGTELSPPVADQIDPVVALIEAAL